jgi:hypothetical protein
MARVFLSHSSRDNDAAAVLKSWLDEQGFGPPSFLDFDKYSGIPPGAEWEKHLYREIKRCQAFLILQTPNWSASRWCFAEFTQARALGKPVFQVVENDAGAAEAPIATDLQRLDLRRDRTAGLEQLKRALVDIALQGQGGFPWPPPGEPDRPPFPGLKEFKEEDAAVFFGRDQEWREAIERLNGRRRQGGPRRLLVLHGSSGSGKSSLLRAGVLPRLRRAGMEWLVLPPLRPNARPLQAMAQVLAVALGQAGDWRTLHQQLLVSGDEPELRTLIEGWVADLRVAAESPEAQILLPIDQAEELFTVAEEQERERFLEVLAAALSQPLPVQALMTIRADAMGSLQALPALVNTLETQPLGPLSMDRYREIIEGPARVVGLTAESAFVERVIRDTATEDALPLLAFALNELYSQSRLSGDDRLSLNVYKALGDKAAGLSPLENVVRKAANDALMPKPSKAAMKALRDAFIPAMVRVSEEGSYTRRAACWDELPRAAHPLLEALVTARLLVRSQLEGEPSKVEVTHEALLRVWPELRMWLEESREFLTSIDQINRLYVQWKGYNQEWLSDSSEFLLKGTMLGKGKLLLRDSPSGISSELRQYIENSIDNERNRAIRGSFKRAGVLLLTSIGVIGALVLIRSNPRLYANLLTAKALHTGSTGDITDALMALHEHRRKVLVDANFPPAEGTRIDNQQLNAFACNKDTGRSSEFCAAESRVFQLLNMEKAPYSLQRLNKELEAKKFGHRYYSPETLAYYDKRFTDGALKDTVVLLFDGHGAGANLAGGSPGEVDSVIKAWMIPCKLLKRIEELWSKATLHKCVLFQKLPNGSYDYENTDSEQCTVIKSTLYSGSKNALIANYLTMKTLGYWFFDDNAYRVAKRYEFCLSNPSSFSSSKPLTTNP